MFISPRYNSKDHPVPFHRGQDLGKLPKKLAAEPAPDLEEAYEVGEWLNATSARFNFKNQNDDDIPDDDDEDRKKPVDEVSADKLIKPVKPKASAAAKSSTKKTKPRGGAGTKKK